MKLPFRVTVNLALGMGLALIVLSTAVSYLTINALISDAQQETQTRETVLLLEEVVSQFKTAESLQRRYLLTHTANDLMTYRQARAGIQQVLLRVSSGQTPTGQWQDMLALKNLIARRVELMEQTIAARQQAGLEAAAALVGSDLNRQLHQEIDGLAQRIKSAETLTLGRSKEEARQSAQTVEWLILSGGVLSLAVLAWAIQMIGRFQAQRRLVEARLSDSEAMSRAITESMAEGVMTATPQGVIVGANSAARTLFGYTLDDLIGRQVATLLPARYQSDFTAFYEALASRPRGFRESGTEVSGVRRDGTEFPVHVSFGDVHVGGQRLFTAIIRDITESRRISQALRDSEAQLRQLTDTVPALIAYVDKDQRLQFHNKAYEEAFGLTHEQIHQKTLLEVMGEEFYAGVKDHVAEALAGYSVRYEREQVSVGGGRREYVMNYFPRYGEGKAWDQAIGFFALGNDVTELKRIDRMKSEFVSTVSHELRTPLTSIRGSLGLVWGGVTGELPEKAKALVGIAKNNCERLIRLINDILDSEKIESGKMRFEMQPVELDPLLEQVLAANEGFAAQHQVKLVLRTGRRPVLVNVDSDRLTQVVTNLLSNAIKFSPAEGTVQVLLRSGAGRVRVEISDKGPGIPEEFRQHIFQKFSQADASDTRQRGGTGLGLSISKAMLERMEGSIGFTTEQNVGTTFFFELPEWKEAPPVTAPMSLDAVARPRILVCEDDPDVAKLIGMMLDKGGFDADVAHTAAQARDYLKMESYAAMTVDIKLPHENGLDLIAELRRDKRTAGLPVVVLSVTPEEVQLRAERRALEISDWLEKPLDEQHMLDCLRRAVRSGRARQ
ncbi:PAS domain S-box protein [Polaromonas sp. JS666]|uniref:PAS domain S-box protein n=1 Tax=Polaromonas sp. (strain JS666 / ATCC BAA-500) TaxID=296591 RepID=UPI00004648CD|nr:PAS domain S-box protein [Polaromonas sp. JS666]ABE46350.1 multi-sensor hybrid histidine kinase [Polaromonas sp. JS666]